MLEYIKGMLVDSTHDKAIVEVSGLGYKLFIPFNAYEKLPQQGSAVCFYITTVIREDSHKSYGFLTQDERGFFEQLIDISGIGPKLALALIGHMELSDLRFAIHRSDAVSISKVPGVGKKTAERLIVELRGKVPAHVESLAPEFKNSSKMGLYNDALGALVNLGYSPIHAQKAIKEVFALQPEDLSLSDLITHSLQKISR